MSQWVAVPLLSALAAAVVGLIAHSHPRLQRAVALAGSAGTLAGGLYLLTRVLSEGILVLAVGSWPAPFGIVLVADLFSTIMVILGGVVGVATTLYATASLDAARERTGYYPLTMVLLAGVTGAFLTGDLFNLYV
ncbi:MAG: Na+/H+ antiporter subunit D, partial [Candidatus Thermoplasmatota archaeon]|nr:Na+/H+ antiporter subunit D [Candidatus Thermoplasmatota archaeon]